MQTGTTDSLLNEAGFLAELAALDDGLAVKRRSPLPAVEQRYEALPDLVGPVRATPAGMFVDEPEPASAEVREERSVLGQVAAAAMFVLMMGVGAAGAAVVFHEQVARIVAGLRIQ